MENAKQILIADNDEIIIKAIENMIKTHTGYKAISAKNGIEAVHLAMVNYRINLILMDIAMPVLNGYDATERIKKIRPNLPVIAITSFSDNEVKKRILAAGCNDIIAKPIDIDNFLLKINKYLK